MTLLTDADNMSDVLVLNFPQTLVSSCSELEWFNEILHSILWSKDIGFKTNPGPWLAGGALRCCFDKNDTISDYDIFFSAPEQAVDVEGFIRSKFGEHCEVVFRCPEKKLVTLSLYGRIKIQLITETFYKSARDLIFNFDIFAALIAYGPINEDKTKFSVITTDRTIHDIMTKTLSLNYPLNHPNATMRRMFKYYNKGYKPVPSTFDSFTSFLYNSGVDGREINRRFYID